MGYNLDKEDEARIIELSKKCRVEKVILFGSRARGDSRPNSDIDLALLGGDCSYFKTDFNDETVGDVECDLTCLDREFEMSLRDSINRDGIILYEDKIDYERRYQLFSEALNDFSSVSNCDCCAVDIRRVFEACFEHSWKLVKLLLESHGESFDKNVAPSVVIEVACRRGIIENNLVWKKILDTYNEGDNVEDKLVDMKTECLRVFQDLKCRVDMMSVENR